MTIANYILHDYSLQLYVCKLYCIFSVCLDFQKFEAKVDVIRNPAFDLCVERVTDNDNLVANKCQKSNTGQKWSFIKNQS